MNSRNSVLSTFALLLWGVALVSAQSQGRGQAPPSAPARDGGRGPQTVAEMNRQVLPTNLNFEQILPVMQGYRDALGVTCAYCHVYVGAFNPMNDFASDAKAPKQKARVMMRMVQTINRTISSEVPPLDPAAGSRSATRETVQVQCVTCHRGVPIPKQMVDIILETGNRDGASSAIARYRELRKTFLGTPAYDFGEVPLIVAAQRANAANKPDDAIAYAQLNLEFNPRSGRSYEVMSQAYVLKRDRASALSAIEKAVAIDPNNGAFQNGLREIRNSESNGR